MPDDPPIGAGEAEEGPIHAHVPVLAAEVFEWLEPALGSGDVLVDCTLGGGGHAERILSGIDGVDVIGIDRDADAIDAARRRLASYGKRFVAVQANFTEVAQIVRDRSTGSGSFSGSGGSGGEVAAFLYDLGVSSFQLDRPHRGFQYRRGAPIDMRMDASSGQTAADVVNTYSPKELADIIFRYGEDRYARRIARSIVRRREKEPFADAGDLAEVVRAAIPAATRRSGPHPARRTFQALRIHVNQELESLEASLEAAHEVLKPEGRIVAISYHSLEDRIVKRTFAAWAAGCRCPRDFPVCVCGREATARVLTKKPIRPSALEVADNRRSDSGRLRVAEKLRVA